MPLVAAPSLEAFRAAPIGRWIAGESFLLWASTPTLAGSVYFAKPAEVEWSALLLLADLPRHPAFQPPFDCVVDASGVDGLSPAAFDALLGHVPDMWGYSGLVRRLAVVRPRGFVGAALTGVFYDAVRSRFPAALFEERSEAFAWLERRDTGPVAGELSELIARVRVTPPLLRKLREHLTARRGGSDLRTAAEAVNLTQRSLQRHLGEWKTSFRVEAQRARIAAAEAMLLDRDLKIEVVAARAGFASGSHLARSFRSHTGESPAEFRRRRGID